MVLCVLTYPLYLFPLVMQEWIWFTDRDVEFGSQENKQNGQRRHYHQELDSGRLLYTGRLCHHSDSDFIFESVKFINSSSCQIGCDPPVEASGVHLFVDLLRQVTGKAGDSQVKGAKNGTTLNISVSASSNYVFIIRKE